MKTISTFLLLMVTLVTTAQDHYAIAVKYDKSTMEIYPKNVVMTLIDPYGVETIIEGDESVDVTGNYTLKIDVPWSTKPEFIKTNGGNLQRFKISENYDWNKLPKPVQENSNNFQETELEKPVATGKKQTYAPKPTLERKEITYNNSTNRKDLLAVFSNGLVYSLNKDGARAWYNGDEIEVQKTYFVQTPEGLLKVSFNAETGEFWYVFEL